MSMDTADTLRPDAPRPIQCLVLRGTLYPDNQFECRPTYMGDVPDPYRNQPLGHVVAELLDSSGELLLRHPVSTASFCSDGEPSPELAVHGVIPIVPGARGVRLVREGVSIFELPLSERPPEVELGWKPPGSAVGRHEVTWEARHPAGLAVRSLVRYSNDDGERWQRVSPSTEGSRAIVDFDFLPGGERCRIAIVARAGVPTATAVSPAFSVAPKACRAIIFAPADGAVFDPGRSVDLRGQGFVLEEDRPEIEALVWTSSRDGVLGSGPAIDVTGLSCGEHEIMLRAEEGERAGIATVHVSVRGEAEPASKMDRVED